MCKGRNKTMTPDRVKQYPASRFYYILNVSSDNAYNSVLMGFHFDE